LLYPHLAAAGVARAAILGLAKHAGKTTALNTLVEEANEAGVSISVQSIGVDGEQRDVLIGVKKPAVIVPAGTWLATAADVLLQGTARLELVETTGVNSPLGELCIARVLETGSVLLAGVRQVSHARMIGERFARLGARLQLIDGAFDRMASGTAELADGIVLAAGASVGRSVQDVSRETRHALSKLQVQAADEPWAKELAAMARSTGRMAIGGPNLPVRVLSGSSPLVHHPKTDANWSPEARAVALPGALTDRTLSVLEEIFDTVLVKDGTHIMSSPTAWTIFVRRGGRILAEHSLRVVALTVNPYSPEGYDLPRQKLLEEIRSVVGGLPVVDCLQPDL
jgi:hypothetical protein